MISLAPIKYRNVLAAEGGPISRVEFADCLVGGSPASQATAFLKEDIVPGYKPMAPEGAGTHRLPIVARFMAISEAIERWALRACVNSGAMKSYGLDVDITSNGMAAFPGLFSYQARKKAYAEAIERHCLISWWEGLLPSVPLAVASCKERGVEIVNPYSSHKVAVLWKQCDDAYYAYSFGYGNNIEDAAWRAGIELERTEGILRNYYANNPRPTYETLDEIDDLILKRVLFFSMRDGFRMFLEHLKNVPETPPRQKAKVIFDGEIPGPWSKYATVWRVVFEPPTKKHLSDTYDYFFW